MINMRQVRNISEFDQVTYRQCRYSHILAPPCIQPTCVLTLQALNAHQGRI